MFGRNKGFVTRVKKRNQNVIFTLCFLYCEALISKTLPADLVPVLNDVVSMVKICKDETCKKSLVCSVV